MKKAKRRKHRVLWGLIYTATFISVFSGTVLFRLKSDPDHGAYNVDWKDSVGTLHTDLAYGEGEQNHYDLYLPGTNVVMPKC